MKKRILIVDDSELILEGLRLYLEPKFEVLIASDGFIALKEFADISVDLIITDYLMPAGSGFGLISSLRQQHPKTPIIAMTGWGKPVLRENLKAISILLKPFDLEELDNCMDELMSHNQA
jgi:DNA-binding response OmpR family regulator